MNSAEIRSRFLNFFEKRGHKIIPSAPLVPDNDPTTLFTGSGMQPMLPYLLGETHPLGTRIVDSQKSFRSGDIEEVGDNRHTTFFEMLGNWSFGDYFQEEQLQWIFQFLTEEIKLDPSKLYVTVFNGDKENSLPRDKKATEIWKKLFSEKGIEAKDVEMGTETEASAKGMQGGRIFYYGDKNWWSRAGAPNKMPVGEPGGPDSEMFYEFREVEHDPKYGENCHPNCDCGRYLEIGNSVFMQYVKVADKKFDLLPKKNIDFGGGFERIAAAAINNPDIFQIDIFKGAIKALENFSGKKYTNIEYVSTFRIIVDHIRASIFLIADGVTSSNTDRGYVLRRLIRRAIRYSDLIGLSKVNNGGPYNLFNLVQYFVEIYQREYPELKVNENKIKAEINSEDIKFRRTLTKGLKELEKMALEIWEKKIDERVTESVLELNGKNLFYIYSTFGFPFELSIEEINKKRLAFNRDYGYEPLTSEEVEKLKKEFTFHFNVHQALSRAGAEQKFKGGLADTSEMSVRYHTATHMLNAALRQVLGTEVMQKGSNITPERLRFDFTYPSKMTDDQKKEVEDIVNEKIKEDLPVGFKEMPKEEAEKTGAVHAFGEKYGEMVKVYSIGDEKSGFFSREFCGGPHISHTGELGHFKIAKEEAVSAGVRRIKAVLE